MIIHFFLYGVLLCVIGSEDNEFICDSPLVEDNVVEEVKKCLDHIFRLCTKTADDMKDIDPVKMKPVKEKKCGDETYSLRKSRNNFAYLLAMERYDYNADYYWDLSDYRYRYIRTIVREFKAGDDYNKFRPLFCPNYTMKACKSLATFCDDEDTGIKAYCDHPSHMLYKEYIECYHSPSITTSNCSMLCNKETTKKLFGNEKTDDSRCKTGKARCEDVETKSLISECEGNFKAKCDVGASNTYSQCEDAIRSMKISPQLLGTILQDHKCDDTNSRLICFQYLKLLGEGKMASQFVGSQCAKQQNPEICDILLEYCGNSNLKLPVDPPECRRQTTVQMTTSTLGPLNESSQNATTTTPTLNRKTEQQISSILLIGLLLLFENSFVE